MLNKKKIAFKTLGCKLNYAETSSLSKKTPELEYSSVSFDEFADVYVINSCSVTANAEKKCREVIKKAIKLNDMACIVIVGCYSQLKADELYSNSGVDIILGTEDKSNLFDAIKVFEQNGRSKIVGVTDFDEIKQFNSAYSAGERTRSFLKIQDGCDYYCSYCTIPYARGRSRSDTTRNIMKSVSEIIDDGVMEIVLSGINIGDFGRNSNESLFELLSEISKINKQCRFRISSIEPDLLSDDIIKLVADNENLMPHFHIPLQAASNSVLKLMNRKYTLDFFISKVEKIKKLIPSACVASDIIVGFPGESTEVFQESFNQIESLPLSDIHIFSYSKRPGTRAELMSQHVESFEIKRRSRLLHDLSEKKKMDFYINNIGADVQVLFESNNNNGNLFGFTENYIKVKTKYDINLVNKIVIASLPDRIVDDVFELIN